MDQIGCGATETHIRPITKTGVTMTDQQQEFVDELLTILADMATYRQVVDELEETA